MALWRLLLLCSTFINIYGMNNGLARTPIMGWANWQRFRCNIDCETYPNDCINEKLFMDMADMLANDGWSELGYNIIRLDDCWSLKTRDNVTNQQVPDPTRFPSGIQGLAKYIHSLGLKLSLYNDIGSHTCAGYTGVNGNYELDANTFVSWDIDMIFMDGCNANISDYWQTYPMFGAALNKTGKPVIYSCSWPAYIQGHGEIMPAVDNTTLVEIAKYCNLWRNYNDIDDSWDSLQGIIQYWARNYSNYSNDQLLYVAGPGNWNDPDMLIVGDNGLSISEAQTQFTIWAIIAAPLLMSNDLRIIKPEFKNLLQNKEIIDVNQDPMGKQGGVIHMYHDTNPNARLYIWMRELSVNNSIAIVMQNTGQGGFGNYIQFDAIMVPEFVDGWSSSTSFSCRNILNHTDLGIFNGGFKVLIQPSSVGMYKLTPIG